MQESKMPNVENIVVIRRIELSVFFHRSIRRHIAAINMNGASKSNNTHPNLQLMVFGLFMTVNHIAVQRIESPSASPLVNPTNRGRIRYPLRTADQTK